MRHISSSEKMPEEKATIVSLKVLVALKFIDKTITEHFFVKIKFLCGAQHYKPIQFTLRLFQILLWQL